MVLIGIDDTDIVGSPGTYQIARAIVAVAMVCESVMKDRFVEGSDPGLCVVTSVSKSIDEFGRRCQTEVVLKANAEKLAVQEAVFLKGLGGTDDPIFARDRWFFMFAVLQRMIPPNGLRSRSEHQLDSLIARDRAASQLHETSPWRMWRSLWHRVVSPLLREHTIPSKKITIDTGLSPAVTRVYLMETDLITGLDCKLSQQTDVCSQQDYA